MNKVSFKSLLSEDEDLKKETKIKVEWKPIEIQTEEIKPVVRKSGLKSLKEVYQSDLDISTDNSDKTQAEVVVSKFALVEETTTDAGVQDTVIEEVEITQQDVLNDVVVEKTKSIIEKAAEYITKEAKLQEQDSFQQPNPPAPNKNFDDVVKKVKSLEAWISKIAAHGPGSGEVRFMFLDDVDKASFADRDTHKILRYKPDANPAFDSVNFDFLSGDQGPIYSMQYDVTGYTANANVGPGLTYYDPQRDTLEILHKDGLATYTGLDNYIRYKNGTANTIVKGSLLEFIGSDSVDKVPLCGLFTANTRATPLYVVGVSAANCLPNAVSRAMLLGEVEDFNASGSSSNESWNIGDLLWASPSQPGRLTNVKPTAPNVVVSVAAVMDNSTTTGRLLVRPTIWPRLRAGDFYSPDPQSAPNTNFEHQVSISNTLFSSTVSLSNSTITVGETGLYMFNLRAQLASTSANQKSIVLWYKKNDMNVPFSAVRQSIATNGGYATIINNQMISLTPQDNVKVFFAVTDTTLSIDSPATFGNASEVPAVQLTVTEPSL